MIGCGIAALGLAVLIVVLVCAGIFWMLKETDDQV